MALAVVLAGMPDLLQRTLSEHVPDAEGRCQECRAPSGLSAAWPCVMRRTAEEAQDIRAGGLPGTYRPRR